MMETVMVLVDEHPVFTVFCIVGVVALVMMMASKMGAGE